VKNHRLLLRRLMKSWSNNLSLLLINLVLIAMKAGIIKRREMIGNVSVLKAISRVLSILGSIVKCQVKSKI
jgi:hypothetical protein